jgi:hypothetical protein
VLTNIGTDQYQWTLSRVSGATTKSITTATKTYTAGVDGTVVTLVGLFARGVLYLIDGTGAVIATGDGTIAGFDDVPTGFQFIGPPGGDTDFYGMALNIKRLAFTPNVNTAVTSGGVNVALDTAKKLAIFVNDVLL